MFDTCDNCCTGRCGIWSGYHCDECTCPEPPYVGPEGDGTHDPEWAMEVADVREKIAAVLDYATTGPRYSDNGESVRWADAADHLDTLHCHESHLTPAIPTPGNYADAAYCDGTVPDAFIVRGVESVIGVVGTDVRTWPHRDMPHAIDYVRETVILRNK